MQVYDGKRPTAKVQLSKREVVLKRIFKMAIRRGRYTQEQFHDFCRWAKGRSESALLRAIGA